MIALWKTMDTDNSNSLTKEELKAGFNKGGASLSDAAIDKMFQYIDKDGSGSITFEEFKAYLIAKKRATEKKRRRLEQQQERRIKYQKEQKKRQEEDGVKEEAKEMDPETKKLQNLWNTMDADQSGTLTKNELKSGFSKGGATLSDAAIDKMFKYIDKDGSGSITFDEFATYMKRKKKKRQKSMKTTKMYSEKKLVQL